MAVRTNILLKLSNFVDSLITFAKLQNIATNKILGRTTAGSGVIEELDIANYSNKLIPLTTTFADAENTTDEIDIVTVTIPADTLAVGDNVFIPISATRRQNSAGAINITRKLKINGTAIVNSGAVSLAANGTTYYLSQMQYLNIESISGNNLTFRTTENSITTVIPTTATFAPSATLFASGAIGSLITLGSIDRTATITITISIQWASASVNAYVRVQQAQAYIIKKAV